MKKCADFLFSSIMVFFLGQVDSSTFATATDGNYAEIQGGMLEEATGSSCQNGCGPDSWISDIVGALLDTFFEDACNRHDNCYCHGYATYCKTQENCDDDFLDDMLISCEGWLAFPPLYADCIVQANLAYAAVSTFGEEFIVDYETQTCLDYDQLSGEWDCPGENPPVVYLNSHFVGCPQHGTDARPLVHFNDAIASVAIAGQIACAGGPYPAPIVITSPLTLVSWQGDLVIFGSN